MILKVLSIITFLIFSCNKVSNGDNEVMQNKSSENRFTRKSILAGSWYPDNPDELTNIIEEYINNAKLPENIEGDLVGLITPHAGYMYSGPVAGYPFKYIQENRELLKDKTVIILGPSHQVPIDGISVIVDGYMETPLGKTQIDKDITQIIIDECKHFTHTDPNLQSHEHSLEIQLPFLQYIFGKDLSVVPIMIGNTHLDNLLYLGKLLGKLVQQDKIFVLVSTDMSHYHPYEKAYQMDSLSIEMIKTLDIQSFTKSINSREIELCGFAPVITLMEVSRFCNVDKGTFLKYATSGDIPSGDKSRVVGYLSMLFLTQNSEDETEEKVSEQKAEGLSKDDKIFLLQLARKTIQTYLSEKKIPEFDIPSDSSLKELGVAFVTLYTSDGRLRGCIGSMVATMPLWETVREMAISAATRDHRFPSVKLDELPDLNINISVLTPMIPIDDWKKIELGIHGVYIKRGMRSGVFLPSVGRDHFTRLEEFLGELCSQKAGLPRDCYKDPGTEIYTFTVEEFDEKEMSIK